MTTEQPMALKLADWCEILSRIADAYDAKLYRDAAAELRRLHAENEKLKTVPMKYRRMAFNAELHTENEALRETLAVMLRDYAAVHDDGDAEMQPAIYQARAALARTGEKK